MKKRYIWIAVVVIVVAAGAYFFIFRKKATTYAVAYTVAYQDVRTTVLATGTVTSQSDLSLGFKNSGTVDQIPVSVGDKVRQGQTLASLDSKDAKAGIAQAQAQVASAQAQLEKVINGVSGVDVTVAQSAVDSAKVTLANAQANYDAVVSQQKVAVSNALAALMDTGLQATPATSNSSSAILTVSGTYTSSIKGSYVITVQSTGNGPVFSISGLEQQGASTLISRGVPQALGSNGLFVTFSAAGSLLSGDTWTIQIPNMLSPSYVTNSNAYQAALQAQDNQVTAAQSQVSSAQAALEQTQAALAQKQAPSRPEDVAAARAAVAQAQAQLQTAQNQYSNDLIVAPIDGTITSVDAKIGETAAPQQEVIKMLDQSSLHVESNISESSIAQVQSGQQIDMTLDAFGPNKHFTGQVVSIDPASVVVQGVIDYRVVSSLPTDQGIKPGMTVNLTITTADKPNVLAVPSRLIKGSIGQEAVSVLKGSAPTDVHVTLGQAGDSYTEITSGLSLGDEVVAPPAK